MDIAEASRVIADVNGKAPKFYAGIIGGQKQTGLFKPLSGLFSQNKYIPLKYSGAIIIELELTDSLTDPVMQPYSTGSATQFFIADNTSTLWQIENVQVKCDVCTLDNKVENIFTQHILSGGLFPLRYDNYISQVQPTSGQTIMVNVNRSASRLKSCFITFTKTDSLTATAVNRRWNDFWSPMASANAALDDGFDFDETLEIDSCYVQIGSKLFPEFPVRSHSEAFYQLCKCLGVQASDIHNLDINNYQYHKHKFIMGIDLEKVLEARGTGFNTKSGDLLTVYFKHKHATLTANEIWTVLVSENILNLSNVGVEVHD